MLGRARWFSVPTFLVSVVRSVEVSSVTFPSGSSPYGRWCVSYEFEPYTNREIGEILLRLAGRSRPILIDTDMLSQLPSSTIVVVLPGEK